MTQPRVDVLVPCYGYAHLLPLNVASLCRQRGVDLRVIILDDASPDATAEVAARLAAADSRVEVVRHDENRGHIANYNHGLSLVEAEFVSLVSADDIVPDGALERAARTLRRHPTVGFVYGRVQRFTDQWRPPRSTPWGTTLWSGDRWLRQRCQRGYNVIASPEVMVRTSTHRHVGGYEPSLPHTADLHLWLRLAGVADVAYLRGSVQASYRVHASSLQRTTYRGAEHDLRERLAMFRHLAQYHWHTRPDVDELLRSAMTALYTEAIQRSRRARERHDGELANTFAAVAEQCRNAVDPAVADHRHITARAVPQAALAGARRVTTRSWQQLRREVLGT